MSLRMITLENRWTGVVDDKPAKANGAGTPGFAAELDRAAQAAKQAEASGDPEKPASLGASAPPRFIEGPGYCFPNPAFDAWLEEMAPVYAAREAERLANLPTAHTRLDDAAVKELAEKYGSGQMSQNQYDDFLDELVHRGVLTRDEIKYMGYQGLVYIKPHDGVFCYQSDEYGNPLEDANGNSLDWARKLMEYLYPDLTRAGLLLFAEEQGIRPAFEAMLDVLERMDASR